MERRLEYGQYENVISAFGGRTCVGGCASASVVVQGDGRGHSGIVHWNQSGGRASLLSGRGGGMLGGRRGRRVVEEMSWSDAAVLVVVTLAIVVVDAVVDAELRAVVDPTAAIFDLQVVDSLFEVSLGVPGE